MAKKSNKTSHVLNLITKGSHQKEIEQDEKESESDAQPKRRHVEELMLKLNSVQEPEHAPEQESSSGPEAAPAALPDTVSEPVSVPAAVPGSESEPVSESVTVYEESEPVIPEEPEPLRELDLELDYEPFPEEPEEVRDIDDISELDLSLTPAEAGNYQENLIENIKKPDSLKDLINPNHDSDTVLSDIILQSLEEYADEDSYTPRSADEYDIKQDLIIIKNGGAGSEREIIFPNLPAHEPRSHNAGQKTDIESGAAPAEDTHTSEESRMSKEIHMPEENYTPEESRTPEENHPTEESKISEETLNTDSEKELEDNIMENGNDRTKNLEAMNIISDAYYDRSNVKPAETDEEDLLFINVAEELVRSKVDEIMAEEDMCSCSHCRNDVIAIALNKMPPKYVVTHKGLLFAKINANFAQFQTDLVTNISSACEIVKNNPRHNLKK